LKPTRAETPPRRRRKATRTAIRDGDCVQLSDGRVGRVRRKSGDFYKVRVRRKTSDTHQFVACRAADLERIACPKGWMSTVGYRRYLRATLAKMRQRRATDRR